MKCHAGDCSSSVFVFVVDCVRGNSLGIAVESTQSSSNGKDL